MAGGRSTDHRNLDLTQFHLDVIRGRSGGKIIWQPRIIAWYWNRALEKDGLPAPYTGMSVPDFFRKLGVSTRVYNGLECFVSHEDARVRVTKRELGGDDYEELIETPVGKQRRVWHKDPSNAWPSRVKYEIASEEEMRIAIWREERRTWTWDQARYEQLSEEWAGLGALTMHIPWTTVENLYVSTMGVEGGVYALADYPGTCEAYFEALNRNQEQLIEVINACPMEVINFGDNVHAGTLSPRLFEKYVLGVYQRRCELLHNGGKFCHAHWDGNVKPLLPYAKETGLDGIEAITPAPQGDVTLEEAKEALGDMFLLDGIPAIYFDKTYSEKTLVEHTKRCIELFAPNLVLGISDEMSGTGEIERIGLVTESVDDYNASV